MKKDLLLWKEYCDEVEKNNKKIREYALNEMRNWWKEKADNDKKYDSEVALWEQKQDEAKKQWEALPWYKRILTSPKKEPKPKKNLSSFLPYIPYFGASPTYEGFLTWCVEKEIT